MKHTFNLKFFLRFLNQQCPFNRPDTVVHHNASQKQKSQNSQYCDLRRFFTGLSSRLIHFCLRTLIVLLVAVHILPMLHIMSIGSMAVWAYFIIDRQICPAKITFHFLFPPVRLICNRNPVFVFFHIFIDHFVIQKMILFCLMFQILDL